MDRDSVIQTLRDAMPALRQKFHVTRLSLFGSFARGDNQPDSDIDVLVAFEPDSKVTLLTLGALLDELESLLGRKVDIVEDSPRLRPEFRRRIEGERRHVA